MRADNEIFAAFCACVEKARTEMGVASDWTVLARGAQAMVNVDKTILVDKVGTRQRGFQNTRFEMHADGRLHEIWEWIDELTYQVSCVRERRIDDTTATVTADEVAVRLKAWFDSFDAAEYLRSHGIAPLLVRDVSAQQYTGENEVYQRYAHFDVAIQVVQELDRTPPVVDSIYLGIRHFPNCNGDESGSVNYDCLWSDGSAESA